jgi:hypothetical protein
MAPPSADVQVQPAAAPPQQKLRTIQDIKKSAYGLTQSASYPAPIEYSGALDHYESFDVTSAIGREFPKLQLTDVLKDDAKVKDLAVLGIINIQKDIYYRAKSFVQFRSAEWCSSGART